MPAPGSALARLLASSLLLACASACEPDPTPAPPEWTIGLTTGEDVGAFLSAWGPNPSEVYIAGGNPEAGALWRFDGEAWQADDIPGCLPLANWVYGFDGDAGTTLWLAANDGKAARRDATGTWTCMDLATPNALWGIWGASDDDVWAVGGNVPNNDPGEAPVLAHWDGSAWTQVELPEVDRSFGALFKVWGTRSDRVWAVGHSGVVLFWDGSTWTQQLAGTTADLISLWGSGDDEVLAVGGRANGVLVRWDGSAWTSQTIGELPGLNGVWMDADGTAFAVGVEGVALEVAPGGFEWTMLDRQARPDVLHGAFGFADGSRFGVGGNLLFSPPWTGVVIQYLP